MPRFYSQSTGSTYLTGIHANIPEDAVPITEDRYLDVIANPAEGKIRGHDASGLPILIDPPPFVPLVGDLCSQIDHAADNARAKVSGDPLRAVEYDRAASEAQAFKDAGYPANAVPRTVSAWAINGRSAQQAADSILAEAAAYNEALYVIRETRLQGKELVRQSMAGGQVEQAQTIAGETVTSIEAAVAGIGNNAGV